MTKNEKLLAELNAHHAQLGDLINKYGGKIKRRKETAEDLLFSVKNTLEEIRRYVLEGKDADALFSINDAILLCEVDDD